LLVVGIVDQPAKSEGGLAIHRNFHRHLVGRSTDAASLGLNPRLGVVNRSLKNIHGIRTRVFLSDTVERHVHDSTSGAFLTTHHHGIDKSTHKDAAELGIGINLTSI
jgi:hypothetical protein